MLGIFLIGSWLAICNLVYIKIAEPTAKAIGNVGVLQYVIVNYILLTYMILLTWLLFKRNI